MSEVSQEPAMDEWQSMPSVVVAVQSVQAVLADPAINQQVWRLSRERLDAYDDVRASDEARSQADRSGDREARTRMTDHMANLARALRVVGEPAPTQGGE